MGKGGTEGMRKEGRRKKTRKEGVKERRNKERKEGRRSQCELRTEPPLHHPCPSDVTH